MEASRTSPDSPTQRWVTRCSDDPGFALAPALRRELESFFCADLAEIVIHTSALSDNLAEALGASACVVGRHIHFSCGAYDPDSLAGRLLLVHELAHVLQKRGDRYDAPGSRSHADASCLEAEANMAAVQFCLGGECPKLSPDPTNAVRQWDKEGHYYTIYLVGLMSGLPDAEAAKLAFYAQMPDQVDDLDATIRGKSWAQTVTVRTLLPVTGPMITRPLTDHTDVQQGLHCLTGNPAQYETEYRKSIIRKLPLIRIDPFANGLAFHAFGDSFAHRQFDGSAMYVYPFGHFLRGSFPNAGKSATSNYGRGSPADVLGLGTEVDLIENRKDLYRDYVVQLHQLMIEKIGKKTEDDKSRKLDKAVDQILDGHSKSGQRQILERLIRENGGSSSYTPEENSVPWQQFQQQHPDLVYEALKAKAYHLIRLWTVRGF